MSRLGERGTPRVTADQVVRTSPARQSLTPNRPRLRRLSDELGLMALGLAARAKRLCLNLFNDTRACGTVQRYTRLLAIPTKPNTIPEASRTGFRSEVEQRSERSDAGILIVE